MLVNCIVYLVSSVLETSMLDELAKMVDVLDFISNVVLKVVYVLECFFKLPNIKLEINFKLFMATMIWRLTLGWRWTWLFISHTYSLIS